MRSVILILFWVAAGGGEMTQVAIAAPNAAASETLENGSPETDGRSRSDGAAGGDGSNETSSTSPRPVCGGSITPGQAQACRGIDHLTLSNPQVRDVAGDPRARGKSGTIEK